MSQPALNEQSARASACQIKVGDEWENISLAAAKRAPEGSQLRCSACGGKVVVHGNYGIGSRFSLQHYRTHDGCPYFVKGYSGTPSRHPDALT